MKRHLFFALALLVLGTALFADSAEVMPARVGRLYLAPTFAFANGGFDGDWAYNAYDAGEGKLSAFNLGFALEYGIIDWITAAVQWAPGVTVASEVDTSVPFVDTTQMGLRLSKSDINANGVADIFIGAKVQIIGEKAPVTSDFLRFALATGLKAPLSGPDFEEQYKNAVKGDPVTAANGDKHVLGIGARAYFDYVVTGQFYINLYGEFIGYPMKGDAKRAGYAEYFALRGTSEQIYLTTLVGSGTGRSVDPDVSVQYGYDLTLELEPVLSMLDFGGGVRFSAGLPFTVSMNPGKTFDFSFSKSVDQRLYQQNFEDALDQAGAGNETMSFSVKPNVSFFMTGWPLPVDFKLQYGIPLVGKNAAAGHALTLQIKAYFKI